MRADPDPKANEDFLHKNYSRLNYERGLAAWFMRKGHRWSEKKYSQANHFSNVLEVGAGTGAHIQEVKHTFDRYIISDLDEEFLDQIHVFFLNP